MSPRLTPPHSVGKPLTNSPPSSNVTMRSCPPSLLMELEPVLHACVECEPLCVRDLRLVDVDADDGGVVPRGHVHRDQTAPAPSVQQTVPWVQVVKLSVVGLKFLDCLNISCCTERQIKVCMWLREISSCSCLTFLPGPAWVLLSKT